MLKMISTGNLSSNLERGLPSKTGFSIALKRTNIFMLAAQFSAVCKFSMDHYAKNQRKFYSESWGFLCPTQTSDGENTGLHNHLAQKCQVLIETDQLHLKNEVLCSLGLLPWDDPSLNLNDGTKFFLLKDGQILGCIKSIRVSRLLERLKFLRLKKLVPPHSEIVCLSPDDRFFPGIFVFTSSCRIIRTLERNLEEGLIGVFEQATLGVERTTEVNAQVCYSEVSNNSFLSLSAASIPFCENNPAVRNIFSSVKCKQAVGVSTLNINCRSDSGASILLHGQSPLVRTNLHEESRFISYPHGINVVLAVLSYSGYDMEDAVVLNKSSVERGLFHHFSLKTEFYEFNDLARECHCPVSEIEFRRNEDDLSISYFIDTDGFPHVGQLIRQNNPILSIYNKKDGNFLIKRYLGREKTYIFSCRLMGDISTFDNMPKNGKKVSITYVTRHVPVVGDKFSDRHGNKGVCGFLMPPEDLPVSESGVVPDILFNPHGLPSRMAVGLLLELMAGKLCVSEGSKHVVDPFSRSQVVYESLGSSLEKVGMDYYGTEKFYSGTSGLELEADVFSGCMYYMRFHHYVAEKYQVKSEGSVFDVCPKTNQPLNQGKSGAIRVGEMEKDAILSHGAMEVLQDRLLHNSDKCTAYICEQCGFLINPILPGPSSVNGNDSPKNTTVSVSKTCRLCCKVSKFKVQIPYVLVYLAAELAVVGIKMKFSPK